jgi:2-amino-4-hydroxy-6-hydroxymethyldihydropteridine diphosphokinase
LGLGSNLGDRLHNLRSAARGLHAEVMLTRASSVYETEPVGNTDQPWFLNAVLEGDTELAPLELLHLALDVEQSLGRVRSTPNAPRTIDIDILLYGDKNISSPTLIIPHPRLTKRGFTLCPLTEIAPQMVHPETYQTMESILASAEGLEETRHFADQNWYTAEAAPEILI